MKQEKSNDNKKILVTGASRGLGLSIVKELLSQGYEVIATSRKESKEIEELKIKNTNLSFEPFDFKNIDEIYLFSKKIISGYGEIYGLVNNAAVGYDGVLGTMHESQIKELVEINTIAPIILTKYISRQMLIANQGRIINISSIIANTGYTGLSVYAATKASLIGFTKSLSRELGKAGITVNAILPGYMETEMTASIDAKNLDKIRRRSPFNELAKTEDVASGVLYLLGEQANKITGICLTIDAGSTA